MIEKAKINDFEAVYTLINELENNTINKDKLYQTYQDNLHNQDVYFYLYKDEGKIKGLISLYVHHYLHHNDTTGEIGELIVSQDYRGQKIGKQLIEYIEQIAQELHLEEVSLSSSMWRKNAHRFYENHGYLKNHFFFEKKLGQS